MLFQWIGQRVGRGFVVGLSIAALAGDVSGAVERVAGPRGPADPPRTRAAASSATSVRRPRGIYAVVVADETRRGKSADFEELLSNKAVSGLAIRMFWSSLQPAKDQYDFSTLDAALARAASQHKTVQLILLPGFGTPSWVLDELPSCDEHLSAPTSASQGHTETRQRARAQPGAQGGGEHRPQAQEGRRQSAPQPGACGKATFEVSEGRKHGQAQQLPLPWNPVYKGHWKAFLTKVAARYETNEAFVSIAVTGPTAASAEIIVPRTGDQLERWAQLLELSYRDPSYHRTDKAFIEEWNAAVTMFGEVFHDVTLVVTRGSGLPSFKEGQGDEAQLAIMSSFARHAVASDLKATQTSGLKACRENKAGIIGVKEMSGDASLAPRVLGGAQFDTSFSQRPAAEGCATSCEATAPACTSVTPRDALANVLKVYFDRTPVGDAFGASRGAAPMNYLQVYATDIAYAGTQPAVQALLEKASQHILMQAL